MNEVNLHRGRYPHLNAIECFVDSQFLTDAVVCYKTFIMSGKKKCFTSNKLHALHAFLTRRMG
jgi:hypothetical protein